MRLNREEITRFGERLSNVVMDVSAIGMVLMTVAIGIQVFGRYVLNDSPAWSEPFALILMLYIVLLSAAVGVYRGFHLGVRFFVGLLPLSTRRTVFIAVQLLTAIFGSVMALQGVQLAQYTSSHVIPTLDVSRSIAYWPFVLCGSLIVLFAALRVVQMSGEERTWDPWSL